MRDESSSDTPGSPAGAARTLIVGFGNSYCGDDGIGPAAARLLAGRGVVLVGVDVPSVDAFHSKTMSNHVALLNGGVAILENLDL